MAKCEFCQADVSLYTDTTCPSCGGPVAAPPKPKDQLLPSATPAPQTPKKSPPPKPPEQKNTALGCGCLLVLLIILIAVVIALSK